MKQDNITKQRGQAYVYARFSSTRQLGNTSTERQGNFAEKVAEEENLDIIGTVTDAAVSADCGANIKAEWAELEAMAVEGDYIIVESFSRICRAGPRMTRDAIYRLTDKGVILLVGKGHGKYVTINKENVEEPEIDALIGDKSSYAKEDNDERKYKAREALSIYSERLKAGKYAPLCRLPPWLSNPRLPNGKPDPDGAYILDESVAKKVKLIFEMYATDKWGTERLASYLNHNGIFIYPKRQRWASGNAVHHVLTNKAVIGYYTQWSPFKPGQEQTLEWESKVFPPIIPETLYWDVQKILKRRYKMGGRTFEHDFVNLFNGKLFCSECGATLRRKQFHGKSSKFHGRKYPSYKCSNRSVGLCKITTSIKISQTEFAIKTILAKSDILYSLINTEAATLPSQVPVLTTERDQLRKERKNLYAVIRRLDNPPDDMAKEIEENIRKENKLTAAIEAENIRLAGNVPLKSSLKLYKDKLQDKWNDPEQRLRIRAVIMDIIEKIVVNADKRTLQVYFKNVSEPIDVELGKKECKINGLAFDYPVECLRKVRTMKNYEKETNRKPANKQSVEKSV